jgi:MYXO-CTERM domain-containing protein
MTWFRDQYGDLPRTFINSTFANGVNVYPSYSTKSCRNPNGSLCMTNSQCGGNAYCSAGRCTQKTNAASTPLGCDDLMGCPGGLQCATDPLKVAVIQQAQAQWEQAMPGIKHVGLVADRIAEWSGAIHCITREVPKGDMVLEIPDGYCVGGQCDCAAGGATQACTSSATCFGPKWMCDCEICYGTCAGSNKTCSADADCAGSGPITAGSCVINPNQGCYGYPAGWSAGGGGGGSGPCGGVSFEGVCNGDQLQYCDGGLQTQSCGGCCGWDSGNGYYNCLSGQACNGCQDECQAGSGGCSAQDTHSWTCVKKGGCNVREYTACANGCSGGQCVGGGGSGGDVLDQCPAVGPGGDAGGSGGTDAGGSGGSDAGGSGGNDTSSGGTDAGGSGGNDTSSGGTDAGGSGGNDAGGGAGDGVCLPDCTGKMCGPNGCGGLCGACGRNETCDATGTCVKGSDTADAGVGGEDGGIASGDDAAGGGAAGDDAAGGGAAGGDTTGAGSADGGSAAADGLAGGDGAGGPASFYAGAGASGSGCSASATGSAGGRSPAAWGLLGLLALPLWLVRRRRRLA